MYLSRAILKMSLAASLRHAMHREPIVVWSLIIGGLGAFIFRSGIRRGVCEHSLHLNQGETKEFVTGHVTFAFNSLQVLHFR